MDIEDTIDGSHQCATSLLVCLSQLTLEEVVQNQRPGSAKIETQTFHLEQRTSIPFPPTTWRSTQASIFKLVSHKSSTHALAANKKNCALR